MMLDHERADRHPDTWPLKRGDTLSNHDWFPFYTHRFLASKFVTQAVMEGRRGDIGTAVILWTESMRQDPAGTLPECDLELASLARYATIDDWLQVKAGVLHGWVPVLVHDHMEAEPLRRLGHPRFMLGIVEEMHKRKRGRDGAREAAKLAVKKTRIRKKMSELNVASHIVENDKVVVELARYFENTDLYVTHDNVRAAMAEVIGYTGEIAHILDRRSDRK